MGTSAIKNFIRFDWTKESRQRKDNYNKEVKFVTELAEALTTDYNKLVDECNKLNDEYTDNYKEVFARIEKALQDSNSIQSQLKKFSEKIENVLSTINKSNANFGRAGITISNCKYTIVSPPTLADKLHDYREKIDDITKPLNRLKQEMKTLKDSKNASEGKLKRFNIDLTAKEARKTLLVGMQLFEYKASREREISKVVQEITTLNTKIATANIEISRLENQIRDNAKEQASLKKQLSQLDSKITQFSNLLISEKLKSVRKFVETSKKDINNIWDQIKAIQVTINDMAKGGNIFTMGEITTLNDNVKQCFTEINASAKLTNIIDKKHDYGEGFFRTISTKEDKLEELKHAFLEVKSKVLQCFTTIKNGKKKITDARNFPEEGMNIAAIENQLELVEQKFKDFDQTIRMYQAEFNKCLGEMNKENAIHAIKPFYSKDDHLLNNVEEVLIIL